MIDRRQKNYSKDDLLELMREQEVEIEGYKKDIDAIKQDLDACKKENASLSADLLIAATHAIEDTSAVSSSSLVEGIAKAAQEAADAYVQQIKMTEAEKITRIMQMEADTRLKLDEAERRAKDTEETVMKMLTDMNKAFEIQLNLINGMKSGFADKLRELGLQELFDKSQAMQVTRETWETQETQAASQQGYDGQQRADMFGLIEQGEGQNESYGHNEFGA